MLQNLENCAKFQKFQLDNLVDFEKFCKTRIYLQRSAAIQPKTSEFCREFAKNWQLPYGSATPIGNYPKAARSLSPAFRAGQPGRAPSREAASMAFFTWAVLFGPVDPRGDAGAKSEHTCLRYPTLSDQFQNVFTNLTTVLKIDNSSKF